MVYAHRLDVQTQFVRFVKEHFEDRFGVELEENVMFYNNKGRVHFDLATEGRRPTVVRCCYATPDQDLNRAYFRFMEDARFAKAKNAIYTTNISDAKKKTRSAAYKIRIYDAEDFSEMTFDESELDKRIRNADMSSETPTLRKIRWL